MAPPVSNQVLLSTARQALVSSARSYIGTKFGHQGRNRVTGLDCGGLMLTATRESNLLHMEFLGYASFPTDGKFDEILATHSELLFERSFPFNFDGSELLPGDLVSFDYGNGEGTRHLAMITKWERGRYTVIESQPKHGVTEHAIAPPFVKNKTSLKAWRLPGLE